MDSSNCSSDKSPEKVMT